MICLLWAYLSFHRHCIYIRTDKTYNRIEIFFCFSRYCIKRPTDRNRSSGGSFFTTPASKLHGWRESYVIVSVCINRSTVPGWGYSARKFAFNNAYSPGIDAGRFLNGSIAGRAPVAFPRPMRTWFIVVVFPSRLFYLLAHIVLRYPTARPDKSTRDETEWSKICYCLFTCLTPAHTLNAFLSGFFFIFFA